LQALIDETGPLIKAVTAEEAASADVVLIALRWGALPLVLGTLPAWNNRIVIDGTNAVEFLDPQPPDGTDPSNPLAAYGIKAIDLSDRHSSEVVRG
ncbi:NAD(P)-binding domain-containing protein, partial [Pseudomonas viridiflava]|uniref:NAD(P)-binding domain-containing protein n=1 Tax=Pseudomonas viridiflava TaxID=33069 RepID=UPI0013DF07CC